MKLGLVGLPNSGKTTLFNAVTGTKAASANYMFSTTQPTTGIVPVPDQRLDRLAEIHDPKKITPATLEIVDIAGLTRGSYKGEGLGNKFLADIREVDALVHVVRCFEDDEVVHVDGELNPARDIETVNLELVFSDLDILERRIDRTTKAAKGDKKLLPELELLGRLKEHFELGASARNFTCENDLDKEIIASIPLLSAKPVIYAANLSEKDLTASLEGNSLYSPVAAVAGEEGAQVLPVCAKFEEEIAELSPEEKEMFLTDVGLEESGLDRVIRSGYALLGLISFLTAGKPEVRAWTIRKGTRAPQAAGKIHTDFEKGFIRAEVIAYNDLDTLGTMAAAKDKGLVRLEGKEYVVQDGDVIHFRFNI
ncbi:MAG: redox-regulated ATPase YchF [Oscillospiraceae bacterium]|nr:redox-regulated ATPase YchF [Oscillospiraceae bacterium]